MADLSAILEEILLSGDICCLVDSVIRELVTGTNPLEQLNVKRPAQKLCGGGKDHDFGLLLMCWLTEIHPHGLYL